MATVIRNPALIDLLMFYGLSPEEVRNLPDAPSTEPTEKQTFDLVQYLATGRRVPEATEVK